MATQSVGIMSDYDNLVITIGAIEALVAEADAGRRLMLYSKQCKGLVDEFKDMRESMGTGPGTDRESTPILRELFRVACDAKTVVENCSCEDQTSWLQAALILNDKTIFKSILDDLKKAFDIYLESGSSLRPLRRDRDIVSAFNEDQEHLGNELERIKEDNNVSELEKKIATLLYARFIKEGSEWEYFAEHGVCDIDELSNKTLGKAGASGEVKAIKWFGIKLARKKFFSGMSLEILGEISTMAMLNHHNVVRFISSSKDKENPAIVMECMEMTLAKYLKKRGRQIFEAQGAKWEFRPTDGRAPFDRASPDQLLIAVDIMYQIASGMEYLHDKPHEVAHRDLKSDNVLINECKDEYFKRYVHVKIADLGLSKRGVVDDRMRRNSKANCGTTLYRAPEMYKKGRFVCPKKADVYAFGIICWEILHGQLPLLAGVKLSNYGLVVTQGMRPNFDASLQCPGYLKDLIEECWHMDPNRRPPFSTCCLALQSYKAMLLGRRNQSLLDFRLPTEPSETRITRFLRFLGIMQGS